MTAPDVSTYDLHGLRVRSEIPLPGPLIRRRGVDLDVRWGRSRVPEHRPPTGEVVAQLTFEDGRGYTLARTGTEWTLRFDAIGEFRFDAKLRRVRVYLAHGGDRDLIPLLLTSSVPAFILSLAGKCILHASAVETGSGAVGFLGGSGMGKSTLAALCCASGARLVTDDLLRLEPEPDGFACVRGPSEIRLREPAMTLAALFPAVTVRRTADLRFGVRVDGATRDRLPLRLLVLPKLVRDCRAVSIERMTGVESLYALTRYARIVGWRAPDLIAEQFARLGRVAANVPMYTAVVPWGPPFQSALGATLLGCLNQRASTAA